jgi:hypothetical protein
MTQAHLTLQLWRQVVVKDPRHLGNVNRNGDESGHWLCALKGGAILRILFGSFWVSRRIGEDRRVADPAG